MFASSGALYLLVLEQNSAKFERVRGLIDLERLERTARTSSRGAALS